MYKDGMMNMLAISKINCKIANGTANKAKKDRCQSLFT